MKINTEDWIRVATAAKMRNVSRETVNYWRDKGWIQYMKIDNLDFVNRKDVETIKISRRSEVKKGIIPEYNKRISKKLF